jgi:hypothetical protein
MKPNVTLTIASLLSIILMIFHMTDDIVRGMEPGTLFDLIIVPILAVWLYGTLALRERRSGYDRPRRVAARATGADHPHEGSGRRWRDRQVQRRLRLHLDAVALGVTSLFAVMLSVHALWEQLRRRNG